MMIDVNLIYCGDHLTDEETGVPGNDLMHPNHTVHKSWSVSPVAQSCQTLCDPMDCSTPGFSVHHQFPELAQTHVH